MGAVFIDKKTKKREVEKGTMDTSVLVAIISGILSLSGVIITNIMSNIKIENDLKTAQAVTDVKIEALAKAVNEHNSFAKRMPVIEEQIKVINHRLEDLEKGDK